MPTGIRYLRSQNIDIIPWAWAINGYFTVIGSALSVIIALYQGFSTVMFIAALCYALAPLFMREKIK